MNGEETPNSNPPVGEDAQIPNVNFPGGAEATEAALSDAAAGREANINPMPPAPGSILSEGLSPEGIHPSAEDVAPQPVSVPPEVSGQPEMPEPTPPPAPRTGEPDAGYPGTHPFSS